MKLAAFLCASAIVASLHDERGEPSVTVDLTPRDLPPALARRDVGKTFAPFISRGRFNVRLPRARGVDDDLAIEAARAKRARKAARRLALRAAS